MATHTTSTGLRLPDTLFAKLKAEKRRTGMAYSEIMRLSLEQYLRRKDHE